MLRTSKVSLCIKNKTKKTGEQRESPASLPQQWLSGKPWSCRRGTASLQASGLPPRSASSTHLLPPAGEPGARIMDCLEWERTQRIMVSNSQLHATLHNPMAESGDPVLLELQGHAHCPGSCTVPTALWGTAVLQPHRALSSIRTAQTGLVGPSLYCRTDVSRGHRLRLQPHPYSCH